MLTAVEVGGQALLLRSDDSLWLTDGGAPAPFGDGRWSSLSSSPGVAWLAGPSGLARVVAGVGGGVVLELLDELDDVQDELVDKTELRTLERSSPVVSTLVRGLCDGRALVAYDDSLSLRLGVREFTQTTLWTLAPRAGALVLTRLDALKNSYSADRRVYPGSIPLGPQQIMAGTDDAVAPLLLFSADQQVRILDAPPALWPAYGDAIPSDGIHAPGAAMTALPFAGFRGFASDGRRALVGADFGRLATVRVSEHVE